MALMCFFEARGDGAGAGRQRWARIYRASICGFCALGLVQPELVGGHGRNATAMAGTGGARIGNDANDAYSPCTELDRRGGRVQGVA